MSSLFRSSTFTPNSISSCDRFFDSLYPSPSNCILTSVYFFVVISMRPLKHASITVVSIPYQRSLKPLCSLSFSPWFSAFSSQRRKSDASLRDFTVNRSLLERVTSFTN